MSRIRKGRAQILEKAYRIGVKKAYNLGEKTVGFQGEKLQQFWSKTVPVLR